MDPNHAAKNNARPTRRSIRLPEYDYSSTVAYFITICVKPRRMVLSRIEDGNLTLLAPGDIVNKIWHKLPARFSNVHLDQFVIMPDHFHGIILLVGARFIAPAPRSGDFPVLGEIVRSFKAATCHLIRKSGFVDFGWQRNYYEHVIRNDQDLYDVREYIQNNPMKRSLRDESRPYGHTHPRQIRETTES